VEISAGDLSPVRTDPTGLAVIAGLPTGQVPVEFATGSLSLNVAQEAELYDLVVSVREDGVDYIVPPIRYPIGDNVIVLEEGESISAAAEVDGAIILLSPGVYSENVELRSDAVLIFGAWSDEEGPRSIIEGNVSVFGGGNRIRGIDIRGELTSAANDFALSFSKVGSATITGNGVTLIRNTFTAGQARVPSSSAVLVDNVGIP